MYIRFVIGLGGTDHRQLTGVFHAAFDLRDTGGLSPADEAIVSDAVKWLNAHLPVPPFESSRWPDSAKCWFKDDAEACIGHVRQLVMILKEHGQPVRMMRSSRPGKILYEDAFQVVVVEWRQLGT